MPGLVKTPKGHTITLAITVGLTVWAAGRRDWIGAGMAGGLSLLIAAAFFPKIQESRTGGIVGTLITAGIVAAALWGILR